MTTIAAVSSSHSHTASQPLTRASYVLLISGLGFVVEAVAAPDLLGLFYHAVASGGTVTDMNPAARLGAALFGALTFGWGATLWRLGRGASVLHAARVGALSWFAVDSLASIVLGYGWNTVSNLVFLAVIMLLLRERAHG